MPRFILNRPIVLVGMMGCGKSTVGEVVAEALGLPFYDSDRMIEKEASNSVASLFAVWYENIFREEEYATIKRIFDYNKGKPFVLSTGDGSFCHEGIRSLVYSSNAITVWVKADVEILLERVIRRSPRHPSLDQEIDLRDALIKLESERRVSYALCDIVYISVPNASRRASSELLLKYLDNYLGAAAG